MIQSPIPTLVVMARWPASGRCKRRLAVDIGSEQAAIIHRKLDQRAEEEAVLRRWLNICPSDRRAGSRIQERLEKVIDKKT